MVSKYYMRKIAAWILCSALMLSFVPEKEVSAAVKVSKCRITLTNTAYEYTKKAIKPKVTVKYGKKKLKVKKNYTISYKNNKKVGTATVVVKGKGAYKGSVKKKFQILPKLSVKKIAIQKGEKYTLKATSSSKVTFKTSDSYVATVDNKGVITGMQDGTVVITVTSNKVKNTCEVTVGKGKTDTPGNDPVGPQPVPQPVPQPEPQPGEGDNAKACEMGNASVYTGYAISVSWNDSSNAKNGLPDTFDHSQIKWTVDEPDMVVIKEYSDKAKESHNTITDGDIYVDVVKAGETYIRASYGGVNQAFYLIAYSNTDGKYISVNNNTDNTYDTVTSNKAQSEPLANTYGTRASSVLENIDFERTLSEKGYDVFNHTSGMAYYRKDSTVYFAMCDVWNSRVLIYKGTSVKDATGKAPVACLGQKNFTSAAPGYKLDEMNYPMDCAVVPDKGTLIVTDSHNDRLLVFDDIAAIADSGSMGVAADHVINWFTGTHEGNATHIVTPWGVNIETINGTTKMIVGNLGKNNILIWNELPDTWEEFSVEGIYTNNYYPDLVLSVEQGSTPRSITWTGSQLIVGDENIHTAHAGVKSCYRVFNAFPSVEILDSKIAGGNSITKTVNSYKISADGDVYKQYIYSQDVAGNIDDFVYADTYGEGAVIDGRLYLVCHGGLYIFNDGRIDSPEDVGDLRMWNTNANATIGYNGGQTGYYVCGGGMGQLFYESDKDVLWYTAFNDNHLVGWSNPEELFDNAVKNEGYTVTDVRACPKPDIKVGADTYSLISAAKSSTVSFMHNPVPESDGEHLVVMDDLDGQLRVYKKIPYSSAALPDYSYEFNHELGDVDLYKDNSGKVTMILTERTMRQIHIWNDYKFDGAQPDVTIGKRIGSEYLTGEVTNVEYDGTYFYLTTGTYNSEKGRLKVLVYKGLPDKEAQPVAVITGDAFEQTYYGHVVSNGRYVLVNPDGRRILVYQPSQFGNGSNTTPVTLTDNDAFKVIDRVNVGYAIKEDGSNDSDTNKYGINYAGSNLNQHFNLYDYQYTDQDNNVVTKKMYERTTISSMYDMLITDDDMLVITNMGDNRIVVWSDITDAFDNKPVSCVIGHSEKSYTTDDLYGIYDYHYPVGAPYENTLYMPNNLCFDGKNVWVGEYKWSNRLVRYRFFK